MTVLSEVENVGWRTELTISLRILKASRFPDIFTYDLNS